MAVITVVLTTYKRPINIVKRAIEGVIAQTFKDYELLVINDYPEDNTLSSNLEHLVNKYKKICDIKYLSMIKNSGACIARNYGASKGTGKYIAFLDDDDVWFENKLELQMKAFENDKENVFVGGYIYLADEKRIYNYNQEYQGYVLENLLGSNFIGGCSVPLIRMDIFKRVGGFDSKYQSSQDYNLWIKLAKVGKFAFIKEKLVIYKIQPDSITKDMKKRLQGWNLLMKDFYKDYYCYPEKKQELNNMISRELKAQHYYLGSYRYWWYGVQAVGMNMVGFKQLIKLLLPNCIVKYILYLKK